MACNTSYDIGDSWEASTELSIVKTLKALCRSVCQWKEENPTLKSLYSSLLLYLYIYIYMSGEKLTNRLSRRRRRVLFARTMKALETRWGRCLRQGCYRVSAVCTYIYTYIKPERMNKPQYTETLAQVQLNMGPLLTYESWAHEHLKFTDCICWCQWPPIDSSIVLLLTLSLTKGCVSVPTHVKKLWSLIFYTKLVIIELHSMLIV